MNKKLFFFFFFFPVMALSQTTKTSLSGKVVTETGQPVVGASLLIKHIPTGTIYGCPTNEAGIYFIPDLKPGGPYQIELSSLGYKKHQETGVFFRLDEPQVYHIILYSLINSLAEVNITSSTSDLSAEIAMSGPAYHTSQQALSLLPSIKRSVSDFIKLNPLTIGYAIAGGNYRQNFITIDGSEFNNNFGVGDNLPGNGAQPVALDAIAEISVNIAPYNSLWESGFIGSSVNMISRSGSNHTEGSIYSYFRNQHSSGHRVGEMKIDLMPLQYHLEGFRIGGPLIIDKLFYFVSFEKEQERYQPQVLQASTSDLLYGSSPNISRPSASELDQIRNYLLSKYNYDTGPYQDYTFENKSSKLLLKLDWNISRNHTFSIRYNQLNSNKPELMNGSRSPLTPFPLSLGRRNSNGLHFSNSNFTTQSDFYSLSAEWNGRLNKKVTNAMRGSYTRQYEPRKSNSLLFPFVDILKDGIPFTSFGYEPYTYGNKREVHVFSFSDHIRYTTRKDTWTTGVQLDYSSTKNSYMPFGAGYYTYASWDDFTLGNKPIDYAVTTALTGKQPPEYSFNYLNASAFVQQTKLVTKRLFITLGLRADLPFFPQLLPENKALAKLTFTDNLHLNTSVLPKPSLLFAPRLSFSYHLTADGSMRLRGGSGVFTGRIPFVWIISQARYSGVYQLTQSWQGAQNTPISFQPDPYLQHSFSNQGALPSIVSVLSRNFKMPQSWKSSLALDLKLPGGFTGTLETLFNKDIRGILFRDINMSDPVPLNIAGYPDNRLVYPANNSTKFINPLNNKGEADATGNFPLNAVYVYNSSKGYYFSTLAQIQKKIGSTLNFSLAYSKSTAKNYNDGDGDQTLSALNSTATVNGVNQPNLSNAAYVVPDKVISTFTYTKQYTKNQKFSIGVVYQGSSEGRFSYTYTKDFNRDGTNKSLIYVPANPSEIRFAPLTVLVDNSVKTYSPAEQSSAFFSYIDQDNYLKKRKGKYAERNGVLFPWRHQFDLKLSHEILIGKKQKQNTLQFSLDVLNVGNLINPGIGLKKIVNTMSILTPANLDMIRPGGTTLPEFQMANIGGKLVTDTFRNDYSINSTYQLQFGMRYSFN
ncbi:hypothetical protein DBR11_24010 [Pedobacter sp. HMWF019]|uniref:TonB-dependent receptor n=1 Tax=Pedobacter sp. HMWF019 TaxID=2056856 RepID=UPI000D3D34F5|nr:carboxypeptidase regulatory-like domain-containing protein [Pedobacter sp. HMWF019]PTS94173.1 hypothetical protein DBR11_24010 [Pedobacter sp. HMWF019]